jgi:hypothetical protein
MESFDRGAYWRDPWGCDDGGDHDGGFGLHADPMGRIRDAEGRFLTQREIADVLQRYCDVYSRYERMCQWKSDTSALAKENADLKKAKAELEGKLAAQLALADVQARGKEVCHQLSDAHADLKKAMADLERAQLENLALKAAKAELEAKLAASAARDADVEHRLETQKQSSVFEAQIAALKRAGALVNGQLLIGSVDVMMTTLPDFSLEVLQRKPEAPEKKESKSSDLLVVDLIKERDRLAAENAELKRKLAEAEAQATAADVAVGNVYMRAAELENQLALAIRGQAELRAKLDAAPEKKVWASVLRQLVLSPSLTLPYCHESLATVVLRVLSECCQYFVFLRYLPKNADSSTKEVEATKALEAQIASLRADQRAQEENLKLVVEQNDRLDATLVSVQRQLDDAKLALRAADAVARESAKLKEQLDAAQAEIGELEATIEEVQKSKCVVCLAPAPDTVVLPCLHLCLCSGCKLPVGAPCPLCRKPVISTTKVFMS